MTNILAGQPIAGYDGGGVNFELDKLLCMFQQLSCNNHLRMVTYHTSTRKMTSNNTTVYIHVHK